ncbi:fatty acid desaturase family protein [Streptomyces albidoflavus]|uniref:fatty acid desaturase family protein n=1 Tax=Streptomyces TaxID=1883 RepID=UPI00101E48EA|nr:fatty acid desaturase [Streptomyces albidoflavus]RZD78912.1 stearoyl-CoA 9-desaturase [Streptomyces albidoflavus]RZE06728.1 stearoyl-CoA 9-desaturase [Streptomyces albidoflavus]
MRIPETAGTAKPELLFHKVRVAPRDQRAFIGKLVLAGALVALGGWSALRPEPLAAVVGVLLLGAMYTHLVELQHQCLHHSAFRGARAHRLVGVPLGLPMLVSYSHYRVRHLQHHRHLGTPQDSEFFGFDPRAPLTWKLLARGLFDYPRLLTVLGEIGRSCTGRWTYTMGNISARRRRDVIAEYRLFGAVLAGLAALALAGHGEVLLRLWLLPLLVAIPLHFLVELPEHLLCDTETTDVLRNTRSIKGSWLTTWFTNGNNLHVEHHAAMVVPINRLRERHADVERFGRHVQRSYLIFYRQVLTTVRCGGRTAPEGA